MDIVDRMTGITFLSLFSVHFERLENSLVSHRFWESAMINTFHFMYLELTKITRSHLKLPKQNTSLVI